MRALLGAVLLAMGSAAAMSEVNAMDCFPPDARARLADYQIWTVAAWTPGRVAREMEGSRSERTDVEAQVSLAAPLDLPEAFRISQYGPPPPGLEAGRPSLALLGGYAGDPPAWTLLAVAPAPEHPEEAVRACAEALAAR